MFLLKLAKLDIWRSSYKK